MGAYGLAWAQSVVAVIEVAILFTILTHRVDGVFTGEFWSAAWRMVSSTGFMSLLCYILVQLFPLRNSDQSFFTTLPKFALIVMLSLGFYVWLTYRLQLSESKPVVKKLKALLFQAARTR